MNCTLNKFYHSYSDFYSFVTNDSIEITDALISDYIKHLEKKHESWQVDQAQEALRLFIFYKCKQSRKSQISQNENSDIIWKQVSEEMIKALRLRHRSKSTEKNYLYWLRLFYRFMKGKSPYNLQPNDFRNYMSHLAVERKISATTQNQAFNAILFFYRHVLEIDPGEIRNSVRSKPKRRLPVVLTKQEINQIFDNLHGVYLLMAKVIYGCGLRLQECLNLRVKDIDFENNLVTIKSGKGCLKKNSNSKTSSRAYFEAHFCHPFIRKWI